MTLDQILNYGQYMTVGHGSVNIELFFGCQDNIHVWEDYFKASFNFSALNDQGSRNLSNERISLRMSPTRSACGDNGAKICLVQFY